jgi:hypothetical protein
MNKSGMSKWFWVGLGLFILGSGPLLAIIVMAELGLTKDPNPNPIGPGLLAFFTFWPSIGCMVIGIFRTRQRRRTDRAGS